MSKPEMQITVLGSRKNKKTDEIKRRGLLMMTMVSAKKKGTQLKTLKSS
jgi:hypothetical protein